jgi:hypothetical protein
VPCFVVFQVPTCRWVAPGPFPAHAVAEAAWLPDDDSDQDRPRQVVAAAPGMAAARLAFRAFNLPGYRATAPSQER